MSISLTTTRARVDENGELRGLELLESLRGREVQVVVFVDETVEYDDSDLTPAQWNRGLSALMAPHFVDDPEEDIYTREDGKPYNASQYQCLRRSKSLQNSLSLRERESRFTSKHSR